MWHTPLNTGFKWSFENGEFFCGITDILEKAIDGDDASSPIENNSSDRCYNSCWISDGLHLSMIFKALVFPGIQHFMNA